MATITTTDKAERPVTIVAEPNGEGSTITLVIQATNRGRILLSTRVRLTPQETALLRTGLGE